MTTQSIALSDLNALPPQSFVAALAEHGVLSKDTYGNVIRLTPPLVIGQAELELARDVIRRTLADFFLAGLRP